jgi:hypothetical protein
MQHVIVFWEMLNWKEGGKRGEGEVEGRKDQARESARS